MPSPGDLGHLFHAHPPLKRWAFLFRPAGRDWSNRIALQCCVMTRPRLIFAVFLAFYALSLSGQNKNTCDYVVKNVWFESTNGLSSEQLQKLHNLVEGRCYDSVDSVSVSKYVYDQLRQWGYRKVEVYDPAKLQVLDDSVHPALISFVIDFRVNDLTICPAVQPRDTGYGDALALRENLERNGVEVWCVSHSKMARSFDGQRDAALFITSQGRFQALFFAPEEGLQKLVITSNYHDGWYAYTFSGTPRWQSQGTVTMKRPWYFMCSGNRLFITGSMQLAAHLESIFGPAGAQSRLCKRP